MFLLSASISFPNFFFFPPVDASLPGGVVLTRAFSSSRLALRCCFFFLFFFQSRLLWFFFSVCFFSQSQSLALVLIFSVCFFPVTILCSVVFFFLFFFSFLWSCVLCRGYMCCVYSYSIILVIMNMGCRSIVCMIGYYHCQFVREGGGKTGWATGGPVFDAPTLGVAEGW